MARPGIPDRTALLVLVIALIGVVLRIAWQLRTGFYDGPVTFEEDEAARNILAGRGYVAHFLVTGTEWVSLGLFGFSVLLAALHLLDGGPDRYVLIGLVQSGLSVVVVGAAYVIGRELLCRRAGVLAAILVALHPALVIYPATAVISPVYDHALAAGVFVTSLAMLRRRTLGRAVAFGMASLLAGLLRPTAALASALALAVLALRPPRALLLIPATLLLAASLSTTVRMALIPGSPGATPMFCAQLWVGNNPLSAGGSLTREGVSVFDLMPPELRAHMGTSEREEGQAFCDATYSYLRQDVPRAIAWQATKYFYFWWFSPAAGLLYPPGWIETYRLAYGVEVALAVAGAVAIWRRGWRLGLIMLLLQLIVIAGAQAVFYVEGRHRLIVECVIAAVASCGAVALADQVLRWRSRSAAPAPRGSAASR